jgi:hypothetical protein
MDYLEFIARVTPHIPDKGQVMIRYYGLYANAHRGKMRKTGVDYSLSPIIVDETSFGQTLVGLGIDLLAIQKAMAHKSLQSTLRYVRADEDKVGEAFDKIGDFCGKNRVNSDSGGEPIQQLNTLEQVS